ncbi:hypothetical protein PCAR4_250056 [Paraburkholderia caribensis]|nr:hypothetical protein PCAR4_250056 [Paraburkholderia caribensis]
MAASRRIDSAGCDVKKMAKTSEHGSRPRSLPLFEEAFCGSFRHFIASVIEYTLGAHSITNVR